MVPLILVSVSDAAHPVVHVAAFVILAMKQKMRSE